MKNVLFFEDVESGGEDTIRNLVFKEKYVNIPISVIDLVQNSILDIDHDTINQDNVEKINYYRKTNSTSSKISIIKKIN